MQKPDSARDLVNAVGSSLEHAIRLFLTQVVRPPVLTANGKLGNYRNVIWLLGDGRSGTTWISNLISYKQRYRTMFEPFHPHVLGETDWFVPHLYMRPTDNNEQLLQYSRRVFRGSLLHHRVDQGNRSLLYNGLLIKDIFANLFAYWACQNFPHIKPVLILRNPFAVALSKYKKPGWFWLTDPLVLLNQPDLYEDYLHPYEKLIREVSASDDCIERFILIWSIINYVPLKQFQPEKLLVVHYEEIFSNPRQEILKILDYVGRSDVTNRFSLPESIIKEPSQVTDRNFVANEASLHSWRHSLTTTQIDKGLKILDTFGFDTTYGDSSA